MAFICIGEVLMVARREMTSWRVRAVLTRRPALGMIFAVTAAAKTLGEILSADIELEPPEEYLAFELQKSWTPVWVFDGRSPDQVRTLLQTCGLTADQVNSALATNGATEIGRAHV